MLEEIAVEGNEDCHTVNNVLLGMTMSERQKELESVLAIQISLAKKPSGSESLYSRVIHRPFVPALTFCRGYDQLWLAKRAGENTAAELESQRWAVLITEGGGVCCSVDFIFMSQMVHVVIFMNKLDVQNTRVKEAIRRMHRDS